MNLIVLKNRLNQIAEHPDKGRRASTTFVNLCQLLFPLSEVTTKEGLEDLLRAGSSRFRQFKAELGELLWTTLVELERSGSLYEDVREAAHARADLLGKENLARLLGVVDSVEAFDRRMIDASQQGPQACYRLAGLNQQVGVSALYADMCVDALAGALTDFFPYWTPESIATLVDAADDYMTTVEDVFLAEAPLAKDAGGRVDYESLRKHLGL